MFVLAARAHGAKHNAMQQRSDLERTTLLGRHILESIVASSSEPVVLLDAQNPERPVVYVNAAYETLTGCCAEELLGRPWLLLHEDSVAAPEVERLRVAAERAEACDIRLTGVCNGASKWSGDVSVRPLHTARGDVEYLLCQYRSAAAAAPSESSRLDVGLLRRALGGTRGRAAASDRTDPVTGLLRYEHFLTLLAHDLGGARRERHAVSVIAFEVVELDAYRGTFGDKAAESAMRMIAAQVAGAFRRASDSCTRFDDTTLVAAVIGQNPEQAVAIAERVAGKVRGLGLHNPRARSARQLWVRHGIAGADADTDDASTLVARATGELEAAEARPTPTGEAAYGTG